ESDIQAARFLTYCVMLVHESRGPIGMKWPRISIKGPTKTRMQWLWISGQRVAHSNYRSLRRDPTWVVPTLTGGLGLLLLIVLLLMQTVSAKGMKQGGSLPDSESGAETRQSSSAADDQTV